MIVVAAQFQQERVAASNWHGFSLSEEMQAQE